MKICGYCGRQNPDEAVQCSECGTALEYRQEASSVPRFKEWFNQPVSTALRRYLWCAAWGGVVLTTLAIKPADVFIAPWFPVGLIAIFPNGPAMAIGAWMLVFPVIAGWAFYFLLYFLMRLARKRGVFFFNLRHLLRRFDPECGWLPTCH
jgi:zinc-ribbon domain